MAETRFTCPHCQQVLRSSRPVPGGTNLKCPKCGKSFSVPAEEPVEAAAVGEVVAAKPAPDSSVKTYGFQESPQPPPPSEPPRSRRKKAAMETADDDDDDLDLDDEEEEEIRPRRQLRRRPAATDDDDIDDSEDDELPRRRPRGGAKEKKSNVLAIALIAGGALLVLLASGGAGAYWYLNRDRNSRKVDDLLVYMPAESQMLFGWDGGTLMSQPAVAAMVNQGSPGNTVTEKLSKESGIEAKDLFNTVVVAALPGAGGQVGPGVKRVMVVKSKVPFDQHKIRDACKEPVAVRYQGRTYFKINDTAYKLLYMPSKWIMVFADVSEPELQALINNETGVSATAPAHIETAREIQTNHFWAVLNLGGTLSSAFQQGLTDAVKSGTLDKGTADALKQARSAGVWGTVDSNAANLTVAVTCSDPQSAKKVMNAGKLFWDTQMRGGGAQIMAAALFFPKIRDLQRELNSTIRFSTQDQKALASARIGLSTIQAVAQDAQAMIPQATAPQPGRGPAMQAPGGRGGRGGRGRGGPG